MAVESLRFEGIRGSNSYGDIAIDDVSITSSTCAVKPSAANPAFTSPTPPAGLSTTPAPFVKQSDFDCDFEKDTCTWTQAKDDIFDWNRAQGPTGTSFTGPTNDHTTQSRKGWYMYIETSAPRVVNDTARLVSKTALANQQYCLQFWYHMYGSHVNQLGVYIKVGATLGTPVWKKGTSLGNKWNFAEYQIPTQKSQFNIVFEGVRGPGYKGDIGLDDVKVLSGLCPSTVQIACDFEDSKLCGWTQDKTDSFDWSRNRGSTGSNFTGPAADHTLGTSKGFYMYIETSSRGTGQMARLISPSVGSADAKCMKFYYNMYGSNIGTLNVLMKTGVNNNQTLWSKSKNQGQNWVVGLASLLPNTVPYQVVFEAVTDYGYRGDIAIDDVSVFDGPCEAQVLSTLENFDFKCYCLSFYYHMYGQSMGTLKIRIEGTVGSNYQGDIAIDDIVFTSAIIFEGVAGTSFQGDIALDDVRLSDGACTGSSDYNTKCKFEDHNICGYTQDQSDDFDWTWQAGQTSSSLTGPSSDHSYGTRFGHYMYLESSGQHANATARLDSPEYQNSDGKLSITPKLQ
ncbi:MAM and LDL-receptor class A domain-containing protein 1-like [Patella vulgata]|uniref:MAM and LDL-receptor class A domain-containing protein 1-like n=1 Tax=Patella vulgata TaxID=6465 RepID=UPI0024A7EE3B|nr:MAM and LDL-receptor class A domain-containing protein 1-like [Patella vulgata]